MKPKKKEKRVHHKVNVRKEQVKASRSSYREATKRPLVKLSARIPQQPSPPSPKPPDSEEETQILPTRGHEVKIQDNDGESYLSGTFTDAPVSMEEIVAPLAVSARVVNEAVEEELRERIHEMEEERNNIITAEEVVPVNDEPTEASRAKRRRAMSIGCAVLIVAVVGVSVGVLVSLRGGSDLPMQSDPTDSSASGEVMTPAPMVPSLPPQPTINVALVPPTLVGAAPGQAPFQAPAGAPVVAPVQPPYDAIDAVPDQDELITYFSIKSPSTQEALANRESPQSLAMAWLAGDASANSFNFRDDEQRLIQRFSLATFYYATFGEQDWTDASRWLDSSLSECEWFGVTCFDNATEGSHMVHSLVLPENNMSGNLPDEVALLDQLVSLSLHDNRIDGTIPSELGRPKYMKDLLLGTNAFSGTVPDSLVSLTLLENLELDNNFLTGTIPNVFESMASLQTLRLDVNAFVGPIPQSIQSLTSLTFLQLAENNLTGSIPTTIGLLRNIDDLNLFSNSLTGFLPTEFGLLTSCRFLALADNSLMGDIPETIGQGMRSLYGLSLANNTLVGPVPTNLGSLPELQILQLDGNGFSGQVPQEVCQLGADITADCQGPTPEIVCTCCSNCPQ